MFILKGTFAKEIESLVTTHLDNRLYHLQLWIDCRNSNDTGTKCILCSMDR